MKIILMIIGVIVIAGCHNTPAQTYEQGIAGKVLWLEGNFMPGPGQNKKGEPVERELYIFEVLNVAEVEKKQGLFYHPDKDPVRIISSNEKGEFKVGLPAGKYSLFSKEKDGLFANLMDGKGNINPIQVKEGAYTDVIFKIDYKAVY